MRINGDQKKRALKNTYMNLVPHLKDVRRSEKNSCRKFAVKVAA